MSSSFALYDRDNNASGSIQSASFVPEYDSSISYEYNEPFTYSADKHYIRCSKGLNNTKLSFDLKFTKKTEDEAKSFLHLMEDVNANQTGILNFNSETSSGVELAFPTGNVYKNMSGFLIKDYSFSYNKTFFDINLTLQKNGFSYFFDWKGSSYLNTGNFDTGWIDGQSYEKFDIVYYPEYNTGDSTNFYPKVNRIEKFYYCNEDHTSSVATSPTGDQSKWSRKFFWDIDDGIKIGNKRDESITKTDNSFLAFNKKNSNQGLIRDLTISLKNRSDKETRSIIHFIEKHEDAKPFQLDIPKLYVKKKFFIASSMRHTFVYKDCNNIEITLNEILKFKEDQLLDSFYVS